MRFFLTVCFGVFGALIGQFFSPLLAVSLGPSFSSQDSGFLQVTMASLICISVGLVAFGLLGFCLAPILIRDLRRFVLFVEHQLSRTPAHQIVVGVGGLVIGLIVANLLGLAFSHIPVVGDYLPIIFSIVLGYLGLHLAIKKRRGIMKLFHIPFEAKAAEDRKEPGTVHPEGLVQQSPDGSAGSTGSFDKILDTSVIIDGRIKDICETGFLDGKLIVPVFVLEELQHIADSSDTLKRTRGRRGLDILKALRENENLDVMVSNENFEDTQEVDSKLVHLAQKLNAKILTNDYNLNKVAQLRGVKVLNINELANAVKPVVIPGETMKVSIVKAGKEPGQGVAYLDDGTMIVVEEGRDFLNDTIEVEVTSALQTAAGRMIFAKPKF